MFLLGPMFVFYNIMEIIDDDDDDDDEFAIIFLVND